MDRAHPQRQQAPHGAAGRSRLQARRLREGDAPQSPGVRDAGDREGQTGARRGADARPGQARRPRISRRAPAGAGPALPRRGGVRRHLVPRCLRATPWNDQPVAAGSSQSMNARPDAPLPPVAKTANPWLVLLVLNLGFFMILLDTTIVNVAIPSILDGLNATLDQILWVLNAYVLVYA